MGTEAQGPLPTKLFFISEIPHCAVGSKIRFLGCVFKYNTSHGVLTLEHNFYGLSPDGSHYNGSDRSSINVDINLVLGSVGFSEIEVGSWINVVGYVRSLSSVSQPDRETVLAQAVSGEKPKSVYIDAVMTIPAGTLRIGEYEKAMWESMEMDRKLRITGKESPSKQ